MTKIINKEEEWKFWNGEDVVKLYQFIWLQKEIFPPLYHDNLSDSEWNDIESTQYNQNFKKIINSLKKDKEAGAEWRNIPNDASALMHEITRDTFAKHWRKCKLDFHKNFKVTKTKPKFNRGRLIEIAKEHKKLKKPYKDFLKASSAELKITEKTVYNNLKRTEYISL